MERFTSRAALGLICLACSLPATAQTTPSAAPSPPIFLDINAGFAGRPSAIESGTTFSLFGEIGSAVTRQQAGAGPMFDVRLGYRVKPRFGIAVGVSGAQGEANGQAAASVPSPIRFASPNLVSLDAPGLKRRELAVYADLMYFVPVGENVTLSLSAGPSMVHLQQGVPTVSVSGTTPLVTSVNESGNGFGGHVGVDLTSVFASRYGAGVFVRYVRADLNLPSVSSVRTGGIQAGGGLRLRF